MLLMPYPFSQDLDNRKQKEEADKLTRQMQQASMHLGSGSPNAYPAPPGSSSGVELRCGIEGTLKEAD